MLNFFNRTATPKPRLTAISGPAKHDRTVIWYEIDNTLDTGVYIDRIHVNGTADGMRYGNTRFQDSLEDYHDTFTETGETTFGAGVLYQQTIPARTKAQSLVSIPGYVTRIDFDVLVRSTEDRRPMRLRATADEPLTIRALTDRR